MSAVWYLVVHGGRGGVVPLALPLAPLLRVQLCPTQAARLGGQQRRPGARDQGGHGAVAGVPQRARGRGACEGLGDRGEVEQARADLQNKERCEGGSASAPCYTRHVCVCVCVYQGEGHLGGQRTLLR